MKGGITKKIEDTIKALEAGQLKNALYLTDREGLERHHQFVVEAARTCLANKDNKEACSMAIKEARAKVQDTVTLPINDTSLEGLEEYLSPEKPPEAQPEETKHASEKTDEELYEECEPCHIGDAAAKIGKICKGLPEEAGCGCKQILEMADDENTTEIEWIKAMIKTAEQAQGESKEQMVATVSELTEYLERRGSPMLKELDKGGDEREEQVVTAEDVGKVEEVLGGEENLTSS
ncbi:hypothetical protein ES705_48429 [subsurface metagenome]